MRDSIEMGWKERTVTVRRDKLLATLKDNLERHKASYDSAVAGYKNTAKAELERHVVKSHKSIDDSAAMIVAKIDRFDPSDPLSDTVTLLSGISFRLDVPRDHSKSYEVAIQMAEWEVGDTIELTQSQFQCFVLDDWDWKVDFENVTRSYIGKG